MVTISRGEVVLCDLNPVVGTEQAGVRPAVILQTDRANAVSPHTIIAPFTTKIRQALLPSHVFVPAGAGGLSRDSVVLCGQIRVIDKRRITRVLGLGYPLSCRNRDSFVYGFGVVVPIGGTNTLSLIAMPWVRNGKWLLCLGIFQKEFAV